MKTPFFNPLYFEEDGGVGQVKLLDGPVTEIGDDGLVPKRYINESA